MDGSDRCEHSMAPAAKKEQRVSLHTVERLSVYRRKLEELSHEGVESIHSHQLAALVGVTPAQLRRDLASFGSYGNIARGYDVAKMIGTISRIIGTDKMQNVGLAGVGDLGRALLSYRGFEERGFRIAAAFDIDPAKVGRVFAGRRCYSLDHLETVLGDMDIRILVLTSRPEGLQQVVDRAAAAGVRAFLNFVPKMTTVPEGCFMERIDISAKLEKLSFLSRREDG
jgi:redox-sensing transcriptional repressor